MTAVDSLTRITLYFLFWNFIVLWLYLLSMCPSPLIQAAAVDSLTRMMVAHGAGGGNTSLSDGGYGSYQYLPRPGERLRCANRQDLETCVVEL